MGSYGLTDWQMIAELVALPALGDLRPTQLMDAMVALLPPGELPGKLFLYHFLMRLPNNIPLRGPQNRLIIRFSLFHISPNFHLLYSNLSLSWN